MSPSHLRPLHAGLFVPMGRWRWTRAVGRAQDMDQSWTRSLASGAVLEGPSFLLTIDGRNDVEAVGSSASALVTDADFNVNFLPLLDLGGEIVLHYTVLTSIEVRIHRNS